MKDESQLEWVIKNLEEKGEVSRNSALNVFITRLGARINDLKHMGWNIEGEFRKTEYGKDYVYKLQGREPKQMQLI